MKLQKLLSSLLVLLLFLPLLQWLFSPLPEVPVFNYFTDKTAPKFSIAAFAEETFQKGVEPWFRNNCGLTGVFIRTANQLNYSLFKQVSGGYRASILLGKEGALYQRLYLDDLNGVHRTTDRNLRKVADHLARFRDYLQAHGKGFLVLMSANKLALYPEWLADRHRLRRQAPKPRGGEFMRALLAERNIELVDAYEILASQKAKAEYSLFPKAGSHWNSVANCLITQELLEKMGQQLNSEVRKLACGGIKEVRHKPRWVDRDLATAINVWDASDSYSDTPYILSSSNIEAPVFQPRVLFVGTSFLWAIMELLEQHQVYQYRDMYYYGKTNHFYRGARQGDARKGKKEVDYNVDWLEKVLDYDLVVFEANEAIVERLGFDFVLSFIRQLKAKRNGPV